MLRSFCQAVMAGAVLLTAAPVLAQEASELTKDEAVAMADRLIAKADASAWFENVTDDAVPSVRHRRSGLVCLFDANEASTRSPFSIRSCLAGTMFPAARPSADTPSPSTPRATIRR